MLESELYCVVLVELSLVINVILFSEPGYYDDGQFGIRIENLVVVKKAETKVSESLDYMYMYIRLANSDLRLLYF